MDNQILAETSSERISGFPIVENLGNMMIMARTVVKDEKTGVVLENFKIQ